MPGERDIYDHATLRLSLNHGEKVAHTQKIKNSWSVDSIRFLRIFLKFCIQRAMD